MVLPISCYPDLDLACVTRVMKGAIASEVWVSFEAMEACRGDVVGLMCQFLEAAQVARREGKRVCFVDEVQVMVMPSMAIFGSAVFSGKLSYFLNLSRSLNSYFLNLI